METIKLDSEIFSQLAHSSELRHVAPEEMVRVALEEYFLREEEDQTRWERYKTTGDYIPHARIKQWISGLPDDPA